MNPYRIILADDHVLLRQGLKMILEAKKDIRVVGEAGDGIEVLNLLKETPADLAILDISMPNLWGIGTALEIRKIYPDMKVLILSMHREYLHQAISARVDGYLLKENADTELFSAIEKIRRGGMYLSPDLSETLMERVTKSGQGEGRYASEPQVITDREREVLKLLAEGKSSKEIAALLLISIRTVEHHRANIMNKLNVKNVIDLLRLAVQRGYVQLVHGPTDLTPPQSYRP